MVQMVRGSTSSIDDIKSPQDWIMQKNSQQTTMPAKS